MIIFGRPIRNQHRGFGNFLATWGGDIGSAAVLVLLGVVAFAVLPAIAEATKLICQPVATQQDHAR